MHIHGAVVEKISVGVVAVNFEDFGDEAASRPALDLNDDVEESAILVLMARYGSSIPL